jgi:glycolate oxidase iron-sulfur subunit
LENRLSAGAAQRSFDTCLLCGICTSVCFAEVPTARLMSTAREMVQKETGRKWGPWFFLHVLLPRPRWLERFLALAYVFKRWGVSGALNRWGLLRRVSPSLAAAEELGTEAPRAFLRDLLPPAPPDAEVIHFISCGPNFLLPEVGEATAALLKKAHRVTGAAPNVCCGLPGLSFGDLAAARSLAKKNIEVLESYPRAMILVDDSSCAATVKDYPRLFEGDSVWGARARAVSERAQDLLEWLATHGDSVPAAAKNTVTYHDACKARYGQKLVQEPRQALGAVEGLGYRELPEADQCCGGGGTFSVTQAALSRRVGERKIQNILSTGADTVLTSSVSCLLQLRAGLRRGGAKIQSLHIASFIAAHLRRPSGGEEKGSQEKEKGSR